MVVLFLLIKLYGIYMRPILSRLSFTFCMIPIPLYMVWFLYSLLLDVNYLVCHLEIIELNTEVYIDEFKELF